MKIIKYIVVLVGLSLPIIGQNVQEGLKRQALLHMQNKKYGEAIDLLNKYLAANAQDAEIYNIRALCHQKRKVYPNALFDFRRAMRLEPANQEYRNNEQKLKQEWYPILYDRIEGHKREIAIDPSYPFNYLEIGKAYRWLEKWQLAENWYDEYLARDDDASPDEIIRFTIILTETGNITKGERILKKWVERYPDDWRLWSRYGYFTLWLGKYSIAENAFENALSFKPFFKEAQDGLDLARREGYVTLYDEDYNFNEEWRRNREYPIDRYYRIVNRNPTDSESRFKLIELLLEDERNEEAYEQLKFIKKDFEGVDDRFDNFWTRIMEIREEKYGSRLEQLIIILKDNPLNREAVLEAAGYYAGLEKYDEADELLSEYLEMAPNDSQVLMQRAKYYSWQERFAEAAELLTRVVEIEPLSREAVDMLSSYYIDDYEYDMAIEVLNDYLSRFDESQENDMRFKLAKYTAWNNDWEDARDHVNILLNNDPNNLDYQLLAGQIIVWTVDETEFPIAEEYLSNVLENEPTNLYALLGMATIRSWQRNLEEARSYLNIAQAHHAGNSELETAEDFYNAQVLVSQELEVLKLREEAADLVEAGECDEALLKLDEYFENVENPDMYAYMEYANTKMCAEDYTGAIEIYDSLLLDSYSYDIALARAKAHLYNQDTLVARQRFEELLEENPDDYYSKLFLGDTYFMSGEYTDAENIYEDLVDETADSSDKALAYERLNMIPLYGFDRTLNTAINFVLPYSFSIVPQAQYYKDNQDLTFYTFGGRLEMGFARYFRGSVGYSRTKIISDIDTALIPEQYFTAFEGNLYAYPAEHFTVGAGIGTLNIQFEDSKDIGMIMAQYLKQDHYGITFQYRDDDARRLLYSPRLLGISLDTYSYGLNGFYNYDNSVILESSFRYIKVSDGNEGNDFSLKIGKAFREVFMIGYEYNYSDYRYQLKTYYSPQEFDVHSLWTDWEVYDKDNWLAKLGGRIGYAPSVDFVVSQLYGDVKYQLINNLFFNLRASLGNSFRFEASYRYFSSQLSLYWSFF